MLEYYQHYWTKARGMGKKQRRRRQAKIRESVHGKWGSAGDPLGAQTPAAQNQLLENLAKISAGRIDDWESYVDPTLSYEENKSILKQNGADDFHTEKEAERKKWKADIPKRERDHARKLIRENYEEIQEKREDHPIVQDIAAEYGEEFVAAELEGIAIDTVTAESDEPLVTANEKPEPTPAPEPIGRPSRSAEKVETDYPGILGSIRLFADYWTAKARVTIRPAVITYLSLLWLWVRYVFHSGRLKTQDRVATIRTWGKYGIRRLSAEPSDSPLVATPGATNR